MKKILLVLTYVFVTVFCLGSATAEPAWIIPAGETLRVAVLTVDASALSDRYNDRFTSVLITSLSKTETFEPLPQSAIPSALAEKGLSLPRQGFANRTL